jgi:Icc-related predicted phosphoesterase
MVVIDCVADLHGHYPKLEGGDLLIVAGDLTAKDTVHDHCGFCAWVERQNYKKIMVIAGNHDNLLQQDECLCIGDYDGIRTEYLQDSGWEFEGLKIWGSPWTLTFPGINPHCDGFTGTEEELEAKFSLISEDVDILITHGPPKGMLDLTYDLEKAGSESLRRWCLEHSSTLKLHVFGHIHESYGVHDFREVQSTKTTVHVNCSHVNERCEPVNNPIRIIL